ncbi:MAG: type II toxin-antitoxin system HicA family toxin [Desulfobulbaceae bacterium]|nr:type II toxin-antitoxin system HicA family toxin [Desulfobulbaceae bacterium]
MNSKEIIKQLEAEGWVLRGVKGSHHVFTHPLRPGLTPSFPAGCGRQAFAFL